MALKITSEQAKTIQHSSTAAYDNYAVLVENAIQEAADAGKDRVLLPGSGKNRQFEERMKEELKANGFKIGWFSSTISNDAIHWGL